MGIHRFAIECCGTISLSFTVFPAGREKMWIFFQKMDDVYANLLSTGTDGKRGSASAHVPVTEYLMLKKIWVE